MQLLADYFFGARVFTKHNEKGYQNAGEPKRHQAAGKRSEGRARQCGGAHIPHRLLLGSPPALESSRLYRGLSSHTPFPFKSALPTQVLTVTSSGGTGMW